MPILGQLKFHSEAPCREAQFLRWEETACINFEGNGSNETKRQADFMLDWLGQEGSRILELHNWSLEQQPKKKKIKDALKAKFQPQENSHLYKRQFFLIRQSSQETFLYLYKRYATYMTCKFEGEGRCCDHKDVQPARNQSETS